MPSALNLGNAGCDKQDMFEVLIALLCGYVAYRAFRGIFQRPRSDKLTGYGVIGIVVMLILAMSLINWLFL